MSLNLIPYERIESKIYFFRGKKVMVDRDLAALYGVKTKALNQAVRRNLLRFPADFMFQLSADEYKILRSQIVTSNAHLIRTFTKIREMLLENTDLRQKIEQIEKQYDEQFLIVFDAIRRLLDEKNEQTTEIGFHN